MTAMQTRQIRNEPIYVRVRGRLASAVMVALGDEISRKIISCAIDRSKTVGEISVEQDISLSTCYRRVNELESQGVLVVERITVADDRRYANYRSCFSSFRILSDGNDATVEVALNPDVADKVHNRWMSMAYDQAGVISA
jgi:DNA-binding Lrp family transcriptional regulator